MSGGLVCWRASTEPGSLWRVDPFTQSRTARVYLLRATAGGTCGSIAWHAITHPDRWALSGWRSRCMWTRGGGVEVLFPASRDCRRRSTTRARPSGLLWPASPSQGLFGYTNSEGDWRGLNPLPTPASPSDPKSPE
jgi:hypothetical protein